MKRKIKTTTTGSIADRISDFFKMIFFSAAENQILLSHGGKNWKKFYSYTELRNHQKRIRIFFGWLVFGVVVFFVGTAIGPILFSKSIKSEVYIPNGKGDILIGNVSKNQVTLIFKTLDAENDYKPLATKAFVEACSDPDCKNIVKSTNQDDYAVTHIIPVDSLVEGKEYYFRINASNSSDFTNAKKISFWGDGDESIKVLTVGDVISSCAAQNYISDASLNDSAGVIVSGNPAFDISSSEKVNNDADNNSELKIYNVQNENNLQPGNNIQAIISWNTNVPASTKLLYREGENGLEKEFVSSSHMATRHAAVLTTFKAGTLYYFKVKSEDENGNVVVSRSYSLHTPNPKKTIIQIINDNFKAILKQIKPR